MKELSLHILDIAENGIEAGAHIVKIIIKENYKENLLELIIRDDGKGMDSYLLNKVINMFFTTKNLKKRGLGLSLLKNVSENCDGKFYINSLPGKGTEVRATFKLDHIDLPPLGNMSATIIALILRDSFVDLIYMHKVDKNIFILDTREIKRQLDNFPINNPKIVEHIGNEIKIGLNTIGAGKYIDTRRLDHGKAYNTRS